MKDYEQFENIFESFKTRHNAVAKRMAETAQIVEKLSDLTQKNFFLDYLSRGELEEFANANPKLKTKISEFLAGHKDPEEEISTISETELHEALESKQQAVLEEIIEIKELASLSEEAKKL